MVVVLQRMDHLGTSCVWVRYVRHTVYSNYPFTGNNFEFCNVASGAYLCQPEPEETEGRQRRSGERQLQNRRGKDYNVLEISDEV